MRCHGISVLVAWAAQGHAELCSQAILSAARLGDVTQLSLSLEHELPTCVGKDGETPLHLAAGHGQLSTASHLLQAGAMMSIDNMGRAPLHFAAAAGHLSAAELLLNAKAYLELEDATQRTALHHASRGGHVEVSELLLDMGSRIDPVDGDSRTPLHHTSRSDDLFNMTLLLLDRGADFELEDVIGFRPLHYSCTFGQTLTTMKLMDLGADVWAVDRSGWSPILHAAAQENLDFAGELVNRVSRPREFPQPDPSRFIVLGQGDIGGMPTWILIAVVVLLLSVAIVIPGCRIIRRFQRASKPYIVENDDEDADDFIADLFSYLDVAKGELQKLAEEWERVNVNAINDLHRVKDK